MNLRHGVYVSVVATLVFGQSFSAQQTRDTRGTAAPATARPPAPSGTGALAGVVTVADGSQPVKFAYVVLIGTVTGLVKVTSTDADGRFAFGSLPVDRFTVGASKLPYLGSVAGARRPGRPGTPIALAAGQKISNVAIRMPMGGAITGVITDERGQPTMSATVILQQWKMQNGQRTLVTAGSGNTFTDDRGRYRFYGLPPGDYVVAAVRQQAPGNARALSAADVDAALAGKVSDPQTPAGPPVRYAPVFFPGSIRDVDAIPITLTVGEERQNVDVRLELVPMSRVEGQVLLGDGQPATSIVMVQPSGLQVSTMAVTTAPDGRFSFTNAPGKYTLTARGNGPATGQFASAIIDISVGNIPAVQLTMRPGITLTGRLVFDGRTNVPAISGRRVPVKQLANLAAPTVSVTTATGEFNLSNVIPGVYVIGGPLSFGPTSDTMTWALQSVVVDERDVTDLPLEITAEALPKSIVVTYGDRFQELSGRLQSQSGAAVSDYTILVFPEDKAYWIQGSRRIVTARPGTDGRFILSGQGPTTLPPGRYLMAAVTDIGKDEQFDPAFLAQIVPAGIPIVLGPGEKKVQDLAIK